MEEKGDVVIGERFCAPGEGGHTGGENQKGAFPSFLALFLEMGFRVAILKISFKEL